MSLPPITPACHSYNARYANTRFGMALSPQGEADRVRRKRVAALDAHLKSVKKNLENPPPCNFYDPAQRKRNLANAIDSFLAYCETNNIPKGAIAEALKTGVLTEALSSNKKAVKSLALIGAGLTRFTREGQLEALHIAQALVDDSFEPAYAENGFLESNKFLQYPWVRQSLLDFGLEEYLPAGRTRREKRWIERWGS